MSKIIQITSTYLDGTLRTEGLDDQGTLWSMQYSRQLQDNQWRKVCDSPKDAEPENY